VVSFLVLVSGVADGSGVVSAAGFGELRSTASCDHKRPMRKNEIRTTAANPRRLKTMALNFGQRLAVVGIASR